MIKFKIISKKNSQLKFSDKIKISSLKDEVWRYGVKSQLTWIEKNIKPQDFHILMTLDKELIGYTLLRTRRFEKNKIIKKYFLLDTIIIKNNYKKKKLSIKLMNFNNRFIRSKKILAFLVCDSNLVKFYKKFNWIKLKKNEFKFNNKKKNNNAFIYNYNKKKIEKKLLFNLN
jgi:predicted GNAT family N-acyltransferase